MTISESQAGVRPTASPGITLSRDITDVRGHIAAFRSKTGGTVSLVPTMGCFHEGHLSLLRAAAAECDLTVVSVFVNPTQFGPAEDLESYPRDLDRDMGLAEEAGAGLLFAPNDKQMYPTGHVASVEIGGLGEVLCGRSRPGHFNAVATVVAKLFNIIEPDVAWFGQKDAQQVAVIRRMATDLDFPVEIRTVPTLREPDGLAMSSRNCYLMPAEREQAGSLYQALSMAREHVSAGETSAAKLRRLMRKSIAQNYLVELEYVRIVDPYDMTEIYEITGETLAAVAARVGRARLIDNLILNPATSPDRSPAAGK